MNFSGGYIAQQVLNGLIVGSFYSLLAVAYALVHAITNRVILSFVPNCGRCKLRAIQGFKPCGERTRMAAGADFFARVRENTWRQACHLSLTTHSIEKRE